MSAPSGTCNSASPAAAGWFGLLMLKIAGDRGRAIRRYDDDRLEGLPIFFPARRRPCSENLGVAGEYNAARQPNCHLRPVRIGPASCCSAFYCHWQTVRQLFAPRKQQGHRSHEKLNDGPTRVSSTLCFSRRRHSSFIGSIGVKQMPRTR